MIEPAMYLAIGFLLASLLGLIVIPLVHARAQRLTIRRMEAAGASIFVVGTSSIFDPALGIAQGVQKVRTLLNDR